MADTIPPLFYGPWAAPDQNRAVTPRNIVRPMPETG